MFDVRCLGLPSGRRQGTLQRRKAVALMNEGRAQAGHDDVAALRRKPSIQGSTRCLGVVDRVA